MTSYLSSACVSLDNLFNVICMLLVFKHNERYYNSFCCLCNKMCVRFCLCFCLNGINTMSDINHKEEDIDMIMERKIPLDIITESTEETICTDNDDNRKLSDDNSNEVNSKESSPENHSLSDESPISPNQSYNDYTNALAVIFLNESNPNSRFDEAQVPMFID